MPWLNNDDMVTLRVCERWQQTAFDEIDDIGIWRNSHEEAVFRTEGSYLTDSFCPDDRVKLRYLETSNIIAYVSRKFPMLDTSPILRVYEAINAWHNDRNANRLPPQLELEETLDRAIIVLAVVHDEIYSRATAHPPASETKLPDGPPVSRIAARPAWNKKTGELTIGGRIVKRVKNLDSATNVVAVLDCFQLENWPYRIDDPLPFEKQRTVAVRRLNETVRSLNTGISAISFSSSARGIRWCAESAPAILGDSRRAPVALP